MLYTVQGTVFSVQCIVYSEHFTMFSVQAGIDHNRIAKTRECVPPCTAVCSTVQFALYCSVQYSAVCSALQCAVQCSVQYSAVCSTPECPNGGNCYDAGLKLILQSTLLHTIHFVQTYLHFAERTEPT